MTPWYLFAALVGWPLVGFFVLFGDAAEGGAGDGFELDGADGSGDGDGAGSVLSAFFSFTAVAFFGAFFGLTGLLLGWLGVNPAMTAIWAVVIGLVAAWAHGALITWLVRNSSDSSIGERHITGRTGRVTVPLGPGRKGRVAVDLDGQHISYVALPYRTDDTVYDVGVTVVIVELEESVVLVAPMDDLE